jgi:threonine dehydrogenase-like Zn-dependent dehydrogenase
MLLNGAQALVVGATGGIGRAVTAALVRAGSQVVAAGRDDRRLTELSNSLGIDTVAFDVQAGDWPEGQIPQAPGGWNLVVVCAGVGQRAALAAHNRRRFPRPVSPDRVAAALIKGVSRDRAEVVVPGWLRLPIALRACASGAYWRLTGFWVLESIQKGNSPLLSSLAVLPRTSRALGARRAPLASGFPRRSR